MAKDLGAVTISVGEGQVPMLIMQDEVPLLDNVPDVQYPLRVRTISDPDLGSKWAEINARYGDRYIYPLVRGNIIVGGIEMWEMSGCIEVRQLDLDDPAMLPEALDAFDHMMGFYKQKGIDIIRIREILTVDADKLEDDVVSILKDHGYQYVNGFYAKGIASSWTMAETEMIAYVFGKQHVAKAEHYPSVITAVADRGYIRGDQEIMTRVVDKTDMKKQMDKGFLIKMTLTPSYQGYTTRDRAYIYRASKDYEPNEIARNLISIIKDRQPVSKKVITEISVYSPDRVSDSLAELNRNSVVYTDENGQYNLVPLKQMDYTDALAEVAQGLFKEFGIFSAENLAVFLDCRMSYVRAVLRKLESTGYVVKGYFIKDDPTLMWMLADDVGKRPRRFSESFVLNTQDNLHVYLRSIIKRDVGSTKSVIFNGSRIIGSFKGKVCSTGAKVEEFEGSDMARRVLKEAAQSVGVSLETPIQREDDEWDICAFTTKLNLGM